MKRVLSLIMTVMLVVLMMVLPAGSLAAGKPRTPSIKTLAPERSSVTVYWKRVSGAVGYHVRYGRAGTPEWETVSTVDNSVRITGLKEETKYAFQVRAYYVTGPNNKTKYTSWSDKKYTKTGGPIVRVPDIVAYANSNGTVTVQWSDCGEVTGYEVNWGQKGWQYGWPYSTSTTGCSVTVSEGLEEGVSYAFRVRSVYQVNGSGKKTDWSDTKYVTVYWQDDGNNNGNNGNGGNQGNEDNNENNGNGGNEGNGQQEVQWGPWSDWTKTRKTVTAGMEEDIQYHWWAAQCRSCGTHNPYWGSNVKCRSCGKYLSSGNVQHVNVYTDYKPAFVNLLGRKDGIVYNGLNYWFCEPQYRYRYQQ